MQTLELALLGTSFIKLNGALVDTDRRKALALLAYLVVDRSSHSRDALSALLWPGYPQALQLIENLINKLSTEKVTALRLRGEGMRIDALVDQLSGKKGGISVQNED